MKIKKGDNVLVISGNYTGKKGKVRKMITEENKIVVEGINLRKIHRKPRKAGEPGGILEKELPIPVPRVKLVCPSCGEPTRVGFMFLENGRKARYCKKCSEIIE
jgi:large subunit ribosomal protein L24